MTGHRRLAGDGAGWPDGGSKGGSTGMSPFFRQGLCPDFGDIVAPRWGWTENSPEFGIKFAKIAKNLLIYVAVVDNGGLQWRCISPVTSRGRTKKWSEGGSSGGTSPARMAWTPLLLRPSLLFCSGLFFSTGAPPPFSFRFFSEGGVGYL